LSTGREARVHGRAHLAGAGAVLVAALGFAAPAPAAAPAVTVTAQPVTYVPQITTSSSQQPQDFTVTTTADVTVVLATNVPGGMVLRSESAALHNACTSVDDATISCLVPGGPDQQTIEVGYTDGDLDNAVATKTTADFTTTMTVKPAAGGATLASASGTIKVRPSADLWIGATAIQGVSASSYVLRINLDNRGPSGSTTTTATVSGFPSQPAGPLPAGCGWTGLTVVCVHHAAVTVDDSRVIVLPVVAAQRGCAYTIHISGPFPDPKPADNTSTYQAASAPCTTPSPSTSPTTTPTPTPSPSMSVPPPPSPSTTPSGPPSGTAPAAGLTGTAPGTPFAAPSPTSGGPGHAAIIAFSVALAAIVLGAILAVVALRRRPPDDGGDQGQIRY
jgi:hypothetical protein